LTLIPPLLDVGFVQLVGVLVVIVGQRVLGLALGNVLGQLALGHLVQGLALAVEELLPVNAILFPVRAVQLPVENREVNKQTAF
jgi:hypothetical protein